MRTVPGLSADRANHSDEAHHAKVAQLIRDTEQVTRSTWRTQRSPACWWRYKFSGGRGADEAGRVAMHRDRLYQCPHACLPPRRPASRVPLPALLARHGGGDGVEHLPVEAHAVLVACGSGGPGSGGDGRRQVGSVHGWRGSREGDPGVQTAAAVTGGGAADVKAFVLRVAVALLVDLLLLLLLLVGVELLHLDLLAARLVVAVLAAVAAGGAGPQERRRRRLRARGARRGLRQVVGWRDRAAAGPAGHSAAVGVAAVVGGIGVAVDHVVGRQAAGGGIDPVGGGPAGGGPAAGTGAQVALAVLRLAAGHQLVVRVSVGCGQSHAGGRQVLVQVLVVQWLHHIRAQVAQIHPAEVYRVTVRA